MSIKFVKFALGVLFSLFVMSVAASAQGVIVPIICERVPRCRPVPQPRPVNVIVPQQLPIKSIKLDTKINAQVATTHVEQIFRNDTDATLEGTYFFPIPETATISEFAIWENDKKLVGEVRTREEARRIYESIVRRQRDPGLLEYAGKNLFQATIFPILPRSDKKLEITYTEVLTAENNTVAYRYPLGVGKNTAPINSIAGKIEIETNSGLRAIYSPSHSIDTKKIGQNRASLSFEQSGKSELQDFQLFYNVSREDFGMSLLTYRETSKDGFFLLTLSPRDDISEKEFAAKDIVFVLDTSGSMAEAGKMEKARAAMLFGVRGLRDADRFNVINFAGEEHLMENGLIPADARGRARGEEFVKNLKPTGGTNINDSLIAALRQFTGERPKMLVFITDGLPTVGETKIDKIIANAQQARAGIDNLRLFTFGVGYDVNTALLDKLAAENGGAADYVEPKEDIEVRVGSFFAKVNAPVLTDIELDFNGVDVDLLYPRKTPDVFKGTQLTVLGRFRGNNSNATLTVRGKTGRDNKTFNYNNLNFPSRAEANDFLPRLWATRRVGWLVEQIRMNGENKELRDEVIELGTRYGIVTPYTSYLAVDENARKDAVLQGLSVSGRSLPAARRAEAKAKMSAQSGADAVRESKTQNVQQSNSNLQTDGLYFSDDKNFAQNVGSKTFYNQAGNWTDAEFKAETNLPEIRLQFASEEYFELIKNNKELAQFFALGEQVVVVYQNRVYRVVK